MKLVSKVVLLVQVGFWGNIAHAAGQGTEIYHLNVEGVHPTDTVTNFHSADVRVYNPDLDKTEVLGNVLIKIVGSLPEGCLLLASQSITSNTRLSIYTDAHSARFEIQRAPTYIIPSASVRSCSLKKN